MIKLFLSVLLSVTILCGCTGAKDTDIPTVSDNEIIESDTINLYKDGQIIIPENNLYNNESANYQIKIPEEFDDYYSLFKHNNGERITVLFNGKSEFVKNYCVKENIPGIELFTIASEKDKIKKYYGTDLGKANNINYYLYYPDKKYNIFNETIKNSLKWEQLNQYIEDEKKYTKIYNTIYHTLAVKDCFTGFGNYKTSPDDKGNYLSDIRGKYTPPVLPTNNIYVNKQCGYQLTFPKDWLGWYFIDDNNPDCISVYFYGKSITGSFYMTYLSEKLEYEKRLYGLFMFSIMTKEVLEKGTYDSIRYVGTANGKDYYFATGTDAPLSSLITSNQCWNDITHEELYLAEKDWEKVEQMNYEDVTDTFKAL